MRTRQEIILFLESNKIVFNPSTTVHQNSSQISPFLFNAEPSVYCITVFHLLLYSWMNAAWQF